MRGFTGLLLALALLLVPGSQAWAQQLNEPDEEEGCRAGELCGSGEVDESRGSTPREVVDPPGAHVRSLITLGLIAALIGTYLFIAFTGHRPFERLRAGRHT